ncbi:MAG: ABC transporter substrate-binding protein [Betaproteobacteria bacterium]
MTVARFNRRLALATLATVAGSALLAPAKAAALRPERSSVQMVVAGKTSLQHLPLAVADQLGFFRHEGLTVEIVDAGHAARAMQLMLDGGFDVCAGPYEHTLAWPGRAQLQQAFVVQTRTPQVAFGVSMRTLAGFKGLADLKGRRIGLAQSGSVDAMVILQVLAQAGIRPEDVSLIELGTSPSAVTALRSGVVDALGHFDPVMTMMEQKGEVRIIADTRTLKGTLDLFGGLLPSACLYAPIDFVQKHPVTCQALTHGIVHALKWLQTAGPGDLIKTVPEHFFQGDRALYLASFMKVRESISPDGLMPAEAAQTALRSLLSLHPAMRFESVVLGRSFTNEFARRSKDRFKA